MGGLLVLALSLCAAEGDKEARAVLEAALKAHGGAESMRMAGRCRRKESGTMDIAGSKAPFVRTLTRDLPTRLRWVTEVRSRVKTMLVMNGPEAYQSEGGPPALLLPWRWKEVKEEGHIQWVATLAPLMGAEFTLKRLAETKSETVLLASHKDAPDVTLYFSKKTGLLGRMTWSGLDGGGTVEKELILDEYKLFGAARLPGKETLKVGGEVRTVAAVREYEFVKNLEASEFQKP